MKATLTGEDPVIPLSFDPSGYLAQKLIKSGFTFDPEDEIMLAKRKDDGTLAHAHPNSFETGDVVEAQFAMCVIPIKATDNHGRGVRLKLILRRMTQLVARDKYVRPTSSTCSTLFSIHFHPDTQ